MESFVHMSTVMFIRQAGLNLVSDMKSKRFGDSKLRLRDILCYIIGIMIVLT